MKCSKCGYNARTIKAMGEHYRKKHPSSMKRRSRKGKTAKSRSTKALLRELLTRLG